MSQKGSSKSLSSNQYERLGKWQNVTPQFRACSPENGTSSPSAVVLALPKTSQQITLRILRTSDILPAVHLTLTNTCHQTHEIRVSAVFVQVKNGWSCTSVPLIRLQGMRTRLLDLHIFNEVLQDKDSAVGIVTNLWAGRPRNRGSAPGKSKRISPLQSV